MSGCESNHGLYVDRPDRLAFVACEGNAKLLDVQGKAVHELAKARLADGAHTVAVDQATHRVYFPLENVNGKPVLRVMGPAT